MRKEILWAIFYFKRAALGIFKINKMKVYIKNWLYFWCTYRKYIKEYGLARKKDIITNFYPCLGDNTLNTYIEPTYFYQDTWAFEKIIKENPIEHVDVGSHHSFVSFLSKVVPLTMVDIRPLSLCLESIKFVKGSLLSLPFKNGSISSLSCLCVIEHIGLGRYGDDVNIKGSEEALEEINRVMSSGGHLFFSVPIEKENKTYFNAHRSFSETYLFSLMSEYDLVEAKYIYNNEFVELKRDCFGVGCYHMVKRRDYGNCKNGAAGRCG